MTIIACLAATMNPINRKEAESKLKEYSQSYPGFLQELLKIARDPVSAGANNNDNKYEIAPNLIDPVRTCALIYFKNIVKSNWDSDNAQNPISDNDKAVVRQMLEQMLTFPSLTKNMRRTVSETIGIICDTDFPNQWPTIVELIVQITSSICLGGDKSVSGNPNAVITADLSTPSQLLMANISTLETCLSTTHDIFKRYREYGSELTDQAMADELKRNNAVFVRPLLSVMQYLTSIIIGNGFNSGENNNNSSSSSSGSNGNINNIVGSVPTEVAKAACEALGYAFESFYDSTCITMGDEHERHYPGFMRVFLSILECQRGDLLGDLYSTGPLVELKSQGLAVITLHLQLYGEDVDRYVSEFMTHIWNTLRSPNSLAESQDDFVISSLNFIAMVCRGPSCHILNNPEMLQNVCENVILPNLSLRDVDIGLIIDEPEVYISKDIEGSQSHTRRRSTCELIRALLSSFPNEIGPIFIAYTSKLVDQAVMAEALSLTTTVQDHGWRRLSTGIMLFTSVCLQGSSAGSQRGVMASTRLTNFIPLDPFFNSAVVPLLIPPTPNLPPANSPRSILAADAIRFVTTFRAHLSPQYHTPILEALTVWTKSTDVVISSFAAHATERLISMRTDGKPDQIVVLKNNYGASLSPFEVIKSNSSNNCNINNGSSYNNNNNNNNIISNNISGNVDNISNNSSNNRAQEYSCSCPVNSTLLRIERSVINGVLSQLVLTLSSRVAAEKRPNCYAMICLMRLLLNYPKDCEPYVPSIFQNLSIALSEACKNPTNPQYNHALFESLGACIVIAPEYVVEMEGLVWESLCGVLIHDVVEFIPYSLQILGLLLDTRKPMRVIKRLRQATSPPPQKPLPPAEQLKLPPHYHTIVPPLLSPAMLEHKGSIPAVVRMITAVIRCDPEYLHVNNLTVRLLEIFRQLLFLKQHDHDAFNVLTTVIRSYPYPVISQYMGGVYNLIFQRIQKANTPKFTRCVILFFSVVLLSHGVERVVGAVNCIQNGLFWMYLTNVWLKNIQKVNGAIERTCCIVALANLLCESVALQSEHKIWVECVQTCLRMTQSQSEASVSQINKGPNSSAIVEGDRGTITGVNCTGLANSSSGDNNGNVFMPLKFYDITEIHNTVGDGGFSNVFMPLFSAIPPVADPCVEITDPNLYFKNKLKLFLSSSKNGPILDQQLQSYLTPQEIALIH